MGSIHRRLLLMLLAASCHANSATMTEVEVIAVEFPPFTSINEPDNGLSFRQLNHYLKKHYQLSSTANFLPPARAQKVVNEGDWCLSFYPPKDKSLYQFIKLSDHKVKIGFYRRTESTPFVWTELTELAGKTVALLHYRSQGELQHTLVNAGLTLVSVESITQGLKMLEYGRVDLVFSTEESPYLDSLTAEKRANYQFSDNVLFEVEMGVYKNPKCDPLFDHTRLP